MVRMRVLYLGAVLLVLTVAAYLPVWRNGLVDFDDELYISTNPQVMQGLTWSGFRWAWTNYHGNYWQPLAWLSLQLDTQLFATRSRDGQPIPSPAAIHGHNLLWHGASVLLLFGVWHRLTGALWRSFLVAALFAVHPMHVESVAWAAERKDVLSVFFGILTLWAYAGYVAKPGWQRYLLVAAAFLLSLLSKPMLITLPFVLLLLDYWPLRRWPADTRPPAADQPAPSPQPPARGAPEGRGASLSPLAPGGRGGGGEGVPASLGWLVLEKVPLFVLAAGVGVVTLTARVQVGAAVSLSVIPLSARLANAVAAYGWYLFRTFCPWHLGVLYPHAGRNWSLLPVLEGAAVLLAGTLLALWQAGRRRWLLMGWLWFVGTLVPVLGLTQGGAQAWADRFSYWPHIGLFIATAWGLAELVDRWHIPVWASGTAGALLLGCLAAMTWVQVGYWRDTGTLWERALAVTRDNDVAHVHLGYYYLQRGRPDKAELHFAEAVRIQPDYAHYRSFLGAVLLSLGRVKEAAGQLQEAVERDPNHIDVWYNLGMARLSRQEREAAIRCFRKVLELRPESADAFTGLGLALWGAGKRQEAVENFRAALDLDPEQAEAWHGLGTAHLVQGRPDEAIEALRKAVQYNPQSAKANSDLGLALGRRGKWAQAVSSHNIAVRLQEQGGEFLDKMTLTGATQDAISDIVVFRCRLAHALNQLGSRQAAAAVYRAAFRVDPYWPSRLAAKAWKLATTHEANLRDPRLAHELASQAIEGVGDPPADMLDTLAAAQAALGQFREAVETAQQALDKASAAGEAALAGSIRDHLRHYERGEPVTAGPPKK
jgi:tetratricopeptide (TPR) repeat protein